MATRRLRPVPETPPRAVLYLRQSVSRDDSISLELQEAAGRDYCRRQGYQVTAVESDPGISGRTWKRPAVQRVMDMVDSGDVDVIVLWKWSRLSRSRRDWAIAVDRVDVAGGRIESATEQVDVSTATGRLARGVLAEFAAFESDRIGEVWKEVQQSRLADGYAPNGKPRFGYQWDPAQKLHVPDAETGPVLADLYRRYLAGASIYTLVRYLNAARIPTTAGGQWTDRSLRRVMDAGFGAGIILWRGEQHDGRHERVVDAETWQKYLDARQVRRVVPARVKRSKYTLSGLVRCERCGGTMVANPGSDARRVDAYRCKTAKERGPEACAGGYVVMHLVRDEVLRWLREVADDVDGSAQRVDVAAAERLSAEAEAERLAALVERTDAAIEKLTIQLGDGLVSEKAYERAVKALEGRRTGEAAAVDAAALEARRMVVEDVSAVAADLLARWPTIPTETRRETLGRLVKHVSVLTGPRGGVKGVQGGGSSATVTVVPVWL
jgi:DNA invertase Pin-like site-specific DNA recombinase